MENKKSVIILLVLLVFILFASLVVSKNIRNAVEEKKPRPEEKEEVKIESFDYEIIRSVNKNNKENYLISPYSIKIALNMLKDGANNESYKQIEKALGDSKINNLSDDTVAIANGLFVRDAYRGAVQTDYINNLVNNYKADVVFDSFETPEKINNWVKEKTKNMIPSLLDDVDSDFVLALVNALAIEVEWEQAFDCNNTKEEDFYKTKDNSIKVAMMHDYKSNGKYFKTDNAKGIILPYKGEKSKGLELIAILPDDEISEYVDKFDDKEIEKIDNYKGNSDTNINLALPKFSYDYEWKGFKGTLQDMGIKDVFDSSDADLSKMLKNAKGEFYVSKAIHKTFIELDEKGTKAAAATGFTISKNSVMQNEEISIRFDKPFVYLIRDKSTKEILFFGTVYEPNKWEGNECNGNEK